MLGLMSCTAVHSAQGATRISAALIAEPVMHPIFRLRGFPGTDSRGVRPFDDAKTSIAPAKWALRVIEDWFCGFGLDPTWSLAWGRAARSMAQRRGRSWAHRASVRTASRHRPPSDGGASLWHTRPEERPGPEAGWLPRMPGAGVQ